MASKIRKAVRAWILIGMVACLIPIGQACCQSLQHKAQQDALKEKVTKTKEASEPDDSIQVETGSSVLESGMDREEKEIRKPYAALYEENKELVGWLAIKGMKIDAPVMQGKDDEFYLHHDFYGKKSKYGSFYVKPQADIDAGTNFIIYGHNMKDGSMFGDLDLYGKKSFYKEHPVISFDTLYEKRTYDIIAVFRSQVYRADDDVFKYYQFYEAETKKEFNDFYRNIKKLSLYDTGVEAEFGDTFLTLSTCAYHVSDGRFVVVAKRTK